LVDLSLPLPAHSSCSVILFQYFKKEYRIRKLLPSAGYGKLFHNDALLQAYGNTLIVGIASTLVATVIGTRASYGMSNNKFKVRGSSIL
jgi:ABC-type spermidine/putrescine transport system permease subunit II